jgi:hypothetical protein
MPLRISAVSSEYWLRESKKPKMTERIATGTIWLRLTSQLPLCLTNSAAKLSVWFIASTGKTIMTQAMMSAERSPRVKSIRKLLRKRRRKMSQSKRRGRLVE